MSKKYYYGTITNGEIIFFKTRLNPNKMINYARKRDAKIDIIPNKLIWDGWDKYSNIVVADVNKMPEKWIENTIDFDKEHGYE